MVLVSIPYHSAKSYCREELFDWVDKADLKAAEVVLRWHRGPYGEKDAVKAQREFFRLLSLEKGASHVFFVGADTIPPLDALPRLLDHHLPIVSGVYYGRSHASNGDPNKAVAWRHTDPEQTFLKEGELVPIDGAGMDCVLIERSLLEQISWHDWIIQDDDYPFYDAAKRLGVQPMLDTTLVCRHYWDAGKYN